ncbi:MAG: hypothetical protein JW704_02530 [Anaerolineaceae bacterium]|nr:hypothetical protein [Anaerolineaceae bacterium]
MEMDHEVLTVVTFGSVILLSVIGLVTLIIAVKLYRMHDVRNPDGNYAWMVPREWAELSGALTKSQERIVAACAELSASSQQERKLLEHLVNAAFSLTEEINGLKNAKK